MRISCVQKYSSIFRCSNFTVSCINTSIQFCNVADNLEGEDGCRAVVCVYTPEESELRRVGREANGRFNANCVVAQDKAVQQSLLRTSLQRQVLLHAGLCESHGRHSWQRSGLRASLRKFLPRCSWRQSWSRGSLCKSDGRCLWWQSLSCSRLRQIFSRLSRR